MLDIQILRKDITAVENALSKRGVKFDAQTFEKLEAERKVIQVKTQELQSSRNKLSKDIGLIKKQGGDAESIMKEVSQIGDVLKQSEQELAHIQDKLNELLHGIPNLPHDSVPEGLSEDDNVEVSSWGKVKEFAFAPKDHAALGDKNGLLNFEAASKIAGSRFVVIKAQLAQLHRALIQFMLNTHVNDHGYTEVNVPYIINSSSLFGTGQLPKFEEDLYKVPRQKADIYEIPLESDNNGSISIDESHEENFYLLPTAEVPVTNLARGEIFAADELPLKYVCHTPCFRSEAGSYGKDTRGMIRQHQFEKVELVHMVHPEHSYEALEELRGHAETILQKLELPYRVVTLCAGDMGFSAAKTYDLEVWLPGQSRYREISSCSNCEDFQARRMLARWRNPQTNKPELLHTLNGSGLAVGRTLIAIMENYQTSDGKIQIPTALQSYMGGITEIG